MQMSEKRFHVIHTCQKQNYHLHVNIYIYISKRIRGFSSLSVLFLKLLQVLVSICNSVLFMSLFQGLIYESILWVELNKLLSKI